ncbi:MAG: SH3 domain-containing protein [Bacteroidales bacterium]|jgi:uncharacterized protein YgiM (DUF1202 family)
MKKIVYFIFAAIAVTMLFSCGGASDYYAVMKTDTLYIRSGPGENYSIVGSLLLGDTVLVDKIETPWCQITGNNKPKGYANGWFLTKVETPKNTDKYKSNKSFSWNWLWWVVGGIIILSIILKISELIGNFTCPNCKKIKGNRLLSSEEIKRTPHVRTIQKPRQVIVNNITKTVYDPVQEHYYTVVIEKTYKCVHCGNEWTRTEEKEEK